MDNATRAKKISEAIWKPNLSQRHIEQIVKDGLEGAAHDERTAVKDLLDLPIGDTWYLPPEIRDNLKKAIDARGKAGRGD